MSVSSDDAVGWWAAMRPNWRSRADLLAISLVALLAGAGCGFGLLPAFLVALAFVLLLLL